MQTRPRRTATILCVTTVVFLGSCRRSSHSTDGLFPLTLQTDWYPQPEMGGFYQAQIQGIYRSAGLNVTIAPGGPYVIGEQQVATGAVQFAMGASDGVLVFASRGLPLVAVAATMQQDPQAVMVHENSPVRSLADLNGHTIAIKPGSIWFQYLLKRLNLHDVRETPATYSVANFLQDPNYIQQAFVTSEPYFARKGGQQVRTMLISTTGYQPYRVFFTSRQFLTDHADIVKKFVDASLRGWQSYLENPAAANAEIARINPAMNPSQILYSVQTLKEGHFVDGPGTPESHLGKFTAERWSTLYQQLVDLDVIKQPMDPATAYTLQFVP